GPESADLLEMKRGVLRVLAQQLVTPIREPLHVRGQPVVAAPEAGGGEVSHRSEHRPSRRSRRASSASWSSRPAATSCSNWRSQASGSYSANQARKAARS